MLFPPLLVPSSSLEGMESVASGFESDSAWWFSLGDDFFVDQLLDFSNAVDEEDHHQPEPEQTNDNDKLQERKNNLSVSPEERTVSENALLSSKEEDFGSLAESELSIPATEGLESLEWLSHFLEESFSDYSFTGKLALKATEKWLSPEIAPREQQPCFITPVQTKTRTKRARTGIRVWPALSPSTSSSSSTSNSTSSTKSNPFTVAAPGEAMTKKAAEGGQPGRRCSHCGVTKTPQWRVGPQGSKSLCNACGVRYKSGRLLPEYRPACSPSFSSELHSNNHRKVMELRRKRRWEKGLVPSPQVLNLATS